MKKIVFLFSLCLMFLLASCTPGYYMEPSFRCSNEDYYINPIVYGHAKVNQKIDFTVSHDDKYKEDFELVFSQFPDNYEKLYGHIITKSVNTSDSLPGLQKEYFSKTYLNKEKLSIKPKLVNKDTRKASVEISFSTPGEYKIFLYSNNRYQEYSILITE